MEEALININTEGVQTLELLVMLTVISLLPSILMLMTSFTRILIVLSFLRNALGIQQTPPNMVLIGLALFLTLFIMAPVVTDINENAYQPYLEEQITQEEAIDRAVVPIKEFMLENTEPKPMNAFLDLSGTPNPADREEALSLPLTVIIPAFMTSELSRAFTMGFLIFIPFLLIDIIVASTLMSMGMVMLPPAMISLPFKLLLFIILNGWELVFSTLAKSFNF